jgi:AcrR family transcriptional regulator
MGRPPKHRADDPTRERLLAAAISEFAERGYAGASLRDIGARAKLNPAGVTYYFATKEKLWLAASEELARPLVTIAMTAAAKRQPPREALRALLGALFDAFAADPRPARLMMWSALQASQLDFDRTLAVFQPLITFGVTYFQTAQRAGELPKAIDVPVVLPIIFGAFIYTFIAQPGQRRHFGADVSDPKFGPRARAALLDGAERLLGFDTKPSRKPR